MSSFPAAGILSALLSWCLVTTTHAQSRLTENTLRLDDPANRPAATLDDVAWLVGAWQGTAFGAEFEEVWNRPSAGSMVGMFKLIRDGQVGFYELMLLVEDEGSLTLKVKHFSPAFAAWEEKEAYVGFKLVGVEQDAIHFSGLSFHRRGENEIEGFIAMQTKDGVREETLVYRRVD